MRRRVDANARAARTSPWPILVAVGLAVSELGVFVGSFPVAVSGLVLFGGSAAGFAHDAGYGTSPVGPVLAAGCVLVVLGGAVWIVRAPGATVSALVEVAGTDGVVRRGLAILVAGGVLVGAGAVGRGIASLGRRSSRS